MIKLTIRMYLTNALPCDHLCSRSHDNGATWILGPLSGWRSFRAVANSLTASYISATLVWKQKVGTMEKMRLLLMIYISCYYHPVSRWTAGTPVRRLMHSNGMTISELLFWDIWNKSMEIEGVGWWPMKGRLQSGREGWESRFGDCSFGVWPRVRLAACLFHFASFQPQMWKIDTEFIWNAVAFTGRVGGLWSGESSSLNTKAFWKKGVLDFVDRCRWPVNLWPIVHPFAYQVTMDIVQACPDIFKGWIHVNSRKWTSLSHWKLGLSKANSPIPVHCEPINSQLYTTWWFSLFQIFIWINNVGEIYAPKYIQLKTSGNAVGFMVTVTFMKARSCPLSASQLFHYMQMCVHADAKLSQTRRYWATAMQLSVCVTANKEQFIFIQYHTALFRSKHNLDSIYATLVEWLSFDPNFECNLVPQKISYYWLTLKMPSNRKAAMPSYAWQTVQCLSIFDPVRQI